MAVALTVATFAARTTFARTQISCIGCGCKPGSSNPTPRDNLSRASGSVRWRVVAVRGRYTTKTSIVYVSACSWHHLRSAAVVLSVKHAGTGDVVPVAMPEATPSHL